MVLLWVTLLVIQQVTESICSNLFSRLFLQKALVFRYLPYMVIMTTATSMKPILYSQTSATAHLI